MQQPERLIEHGEQSRASLGARGTFLFGSDVSFRELDIPVAEIVPEDVIKRLDCAMKFIRIDRGVELARGFACLTPKAPE